MDLSVLFVAQIQVQPAKYQSYLVQIAVGSAPKLYEASHGKIFSLFDFFQSKYFSYWFSKRQVSHSQNLDRIEQRCGHCLNLDF